MRDWNRPKYPIATSSAIAGQTLATGRSWYGKRWLYPGPLLGEDQHPHKGATTLVSGRSVMAHAIAARLAVLGIHPELACTAARRFTDFSDGIEAPGFHRDPGKLFDGSFTYLAVYPNGEVRVIRTAGIQKKRRNKETGKFDTVVDRPDVEDLLFGIGQRDGCWLLPLDFIVKSVVEELDKCDLAAGGG